LALANATLCLVQGRFREAHRYLECSHETMLREKAGETSGLRAHLLVRALYGMGDYAGCRTLCEWLRDKCPIDAGNMRAIDWGRRTLEALGDR
jgi:hypothetical protein